MAKIIKNEEGQFFFDAQDGSEIVAVRVWNEKSKATEANPEGKPWIVLPNDNITNRKYVSLNLFETENVDGELEVAVKTSGKRVLGATGVDQKIIKHLNEEEATEYTDLVTTAVELFKEAKASTKKKKPEDMNAEELEIYIEALRNGTKVSVATGPKSFLEMFNDDEYARYHELVALAMENKANAPKAERAKLTDEQKAARAEKKKAAEISKAEALLAALMA